MPLDLPRLEALSKDEQIPILNLPLDRTYVVTGGPGTGKTLLALHRAARCQEEHPGNSIKLLSFNKPLMLYLSKAVEQLQLGDAQAQTWHQWLFSHLTELGHTPQHLQVERFKYDWTKVEPLFEDAPPIFGHVIIDEGQDFPPALHRILSKLATSATVFADSQQVTDGAYASAIADITSAWSAGARRFYLTRNYRNTIEISQLLRLFYTGDPADLLAHPIRQGDKPMLWSLESGECITRMSNWIESNVVSRNGGWSRMVAVLVKQGDQDHYHKELKRSLTHTKVPVQVYMPGQSGFDFETGGVKVVGHQTMKGLEFDAVLIPEVDGGFCPSETREMLNAFYVASSRAKDTLILATEMPQADCPVLNRIRAHEGVVECV